MIDLFPIFRKPFQKRPQVRFIYIEEVRPGSLSDSLDKATEAYHRMQKQGRKDLEKKLNQRLGL